MVAVALPATVDAEKNQWRTPPALYAALDREFAFTTDAAATAENALAPEFWTAETNGLQQSWQARRVFVNPPYGRGYAGWQNWVEKACAASVSGCPLAVLLIPADTSTQVWHHCILPFAREIRFVRGRVRFLRPNGQPADMPTFASAVVVFGRFSRTGQTVRSWHWEAQS